MTLRSRNVDGQVFFQLIALASTVRFAPQEPGIALAKANGLEGVRPHAPGSSEISISAWTIWAPVKGLSLNPDWPLRT